MKNARKKRAEAERAAQWVAHEIYGCVVSRRAVRTQWQSVDFFAADVVGKKADGTHIYIQATAGRHAAVTARRRKLEKIPWHKTDTVIILQLIQTIDPANARKKLWFFRVHRLSCGVWNTYENAIPIPQKWFKSRQGKRRIIE